MLKNKKSLLALVLSLALVVGSLAGYTIWNNAKDPIAKQASNSVSDYLEAYSSEYNLDTNVLGDASESNTGKVQLLTKEEIAQLSDTVYTTIQTTYTSDELVSEEDITNLKAQIYQSVYNQLYDKASSDVINNVYENVIAICLDDLYNYADNQDAILKAALDDAIADIADNLLSVSDRVATAESDYETLDLMLSEYQAETGLELETMGKFYQALNASLNATNSQITDNTVSIMALESASKDTADRLNSLITSDLSQGNDNQALSASAGKTLFETMTAYYSNNNSNITNLSNNIDKKTAALESELLTLNNSVDSNANDLTNLNTRADSLRSDIDSLIDELGEANSDTINKTITNINNQLTQLLSQQNVDVTNLIDYLQQLYNNADDDSKKLIQQLIVELSKTQAVVDSDLADLLKLLSDAQNATDDTSYQNAINSIKVLMESIKVSSPDIYNQINSYLEQVYQGDKLSINNVIDIVSGTLIEHNANLSQYLSNMLNLINNSELKDSPLFIEIIGKIKELQSLDTTMMQSAIYNSLQNLYGTIGSDTETMYNAVNSAILELNQANQNVFNQLTAVETKLSEDLAYTYYLLSSDLKLTNEELTNDIYAKYTELREADTVYNNALLTELNSVNESLREQNAKTKEQLLSDMAALSTAMSEADLAQLEALKAADEEAYNDLINRLTSLSDDLASADERNLAYLEKANSESYADLLSQLNGVNDTLLNLSEENLATLRAENEDAYNALTSALDVLGKEKDANVAELQSNLATLNSELSSTQKEQYADLISKLTTAEESLAAANSASDEALRADLDKLSSDLASADAEAFNELTTRIAGVSASMEQANAQLNADLSSQLSALQLNLSNADAINKNDLLNQLDSAKAALEAANNDSYVDLVNQLGNLHTELSNAQNEDYEDLIGQLGTLESTLSANASADKTEVLNTIELVKSQLEADDAENNADLINKLTSLQNDLETADASNMANVISQITNVKSELTDSQNKDFDNLVGQLGDLEATLSADVSANKAEVLSTIDRVKAQLEAEGAENNAELINKLTTLQSDLETADADNMINLVSQITDAKSELTRVNEESYADLVSQLTTTETSLKDTVAADKAELTATLNSVKESLEASDASNKAELVNTIIDLQTSLETADSTNKAELETALANAKQSLEASDAANKTELLNSLSSVESALQSNIDTNLANLTAMDKANKEALQAELAAAKKALEDSDLANKTELLASLDGIASDLATEEGARIAAINSLDSKLAEAKSALEASDAANKTALTNTINSVQTALDKEIETQVATLIKADADNLATLKAADNAINTDLLAHAAELDALAAKNTTQDTTLTNIQNKDATQDTTITSIQNKDKAQDTSIANIQSKDTTQDNKLTELETAIGKAQSKADQAFQFASDGKSDIANAVTGRGVTVNSNMTFAELSDSIESIGDKANATSSTMLQGTKAYVDGVYVDGSIEKKTAINKTLNAGESVTIPLGYYNTASVVNVATLASQTEANATAADVLYGKTVWVNGTELTGSMTNNGAVAKTLVAGQSYTIPKGYHNGSGTVTVKSLADLTAITTNGAAAGDILSGKQAYVNGTLITGTMVNNGAKTTTLNAGGSYTIPAGYHNGSGKITAATLASQTVADATTSNILNGKTAWVNGTKITGTIPSKAAATITPSTSNQTIASGQYLSGTQTIAGDADLVAGNIKAGVNMFGVTGTYTSDATAKTSDILKGKTAYANGNKLAGTYDVEAAYREAYFDNVRIYRGKVSDFFTVTDPIGIDGSSWKALASDSKGSVNLNADLSQFGIDLQKNTIYISVTLGKYGNDYFRMSRGYASGTTTAQYWYLDTMTSSVILTEGRHYHASDDSYPRCKIDYAKKAFSVQTAATSTGNYGYSALGIGRGSPADNTFGIGFSGFTTSGTTTSHFSIKQSVGSLPVTITIVDFGDITYEYILKTGDQSELDSILATLPAGYTYAEVSAKQYWFYHSTNSYKFWE